MTFHIGAKPGEIAETVLLPGDPYRARWAAQTFLENPVLVNEVRGMLGYTGTWRGHPVTIHGSGMGMPSLSISANELIRDYGAQTLIRIGSAGALQHHVQVRDVVLAQTASTLGSPSQSMFREMHFAPCADFGQNWLHLAGFVYPCSSVVRVLFEKPSVKQPFYRTIPEGGRKNYLENVKFIDH